jgi:hypothetical protein
MSTAWEHNTCVSMSRLTTTSAPKQVLTEEIANWVRPRCISLSLPEIYKGPGSSGAYTAQNGGCRQWQESGTVAASGPAWQGRPIYCLRVGAQGCDKEAHRQAAQEAGTAGSTTDELIRYAAEKRFWPKSLGTTAKGKQRRDKRIGWTNSTSTAFLFRSPRWVVSSRLLTR